MAISRFSDSGAFVYDLLLGTAPVGMHTQDWVTSALNVIDSGNLSAEYPMDWWLRRGVG
jgi:hypothetical protein